MSRVTTPILHSPCTCIGAGLPQQAKIHMCQAPGGGNGRGHTCSDLRRCSNPIVERRLQREWVVQNTRMRFSSMPGSDHVKAAAVGMTMNTETRRGRSRPRGRPAGSSSAVHHSATKTPLNPTVLPQRAPLNSGRLNS